MDASVFRTLVLDRLALPLPAVALKCEGCGAQVGREGIHYSCCTRTGRIRRRAAPTERTAARICREAGAVVKTNVLLRDMNVGVGAGDGRQLEVLAQGLPCYAGAQLAVDVMLRSSLTACGEARGRAAFEDGATCTDARRDKEATYNELIYLSRAVGVAWLSLPWRLAVAAAARPWSSWRRFLGRVPGQQCHWSAMPRRWVGGGAGSECWPVQLRGHGPSQSLCRLICSGARQWMGMPHPTPTSWPRMQSEGCR